MSPPSRSRPCAERALRVLPAECDSRGRAVIGGETYIGRTFGRTSNHARAGGVYPEVVADLAPARNRADDLLDHDRRESRHGTRGAHGRIEVA